MSKERSLPSALEAERVTIRSTILDPRTLPVVMQMVDYGDFYDDQLRAIYRTIVRQHLAGQPVDVVLISQELRDTTLFPEAGRSIAVVMGEIAASASTAAHAEHYAKIVAKVGQRRRAILRTTNALDRLWHDDDADEVIADLRGSIENIRVRLQGDPSATTEALFNRWAEGIVERQTQPVYECGPPGSEISKIAIGPEHVALLGAPPAAGKTALMGQIGFDTLRQEGQEKLRLLIANVEMSPSALLTRQLCRSSGVSYTYLQHRDYSEDARPRIEAAIEDLRSLMPRVEFLRPPFSLENLRRRVEAFEADIVVVDYAQRFTSEARHTDLRTQTNAVMDCCRLLADQGRAVLVVSALSRQKSAGGASYDHKSMGLASFRESSELEYGCDSGWLLLREPDSDRVELKCVKNRTGKLCSLRLLFDGSHQSFRDDHQAYEWKP